MEIKINSAFEKSIKLNQTSEDYIEEYYVIIDFYENIVKFKHYRFLVNKTNTKLLSSETGTALNENLQNILLIDFYNVYSFPLFKKEVIKKIENNVYSIALSKKKGIKKIENDDSIYSEILIHENLENSALIRKSNQNLYLKYEVWEKFDINTDSFTGKKEITGVSYIIDAQNYN